MNTSITPPRVQAGTAWPLFMPTVWRRAVILKWLKRTHAWCGLWGGVFGLLFGATGILLNHRAVMKLPLVDAAPSSFTVPVDASTWGAANARTPQAMAQWLAAAWQVPPDRLRSQRDPARAVPWGHANVQQPERWEFSLSGPKGSINAEYWAGNSVVSIKRKDGNAFYFLTRLHMSQGLHPVWILAADTIAGCLIVLSISGTLLWSRLHGPRLLAASLFGIPLTALLTGMLLSL
ncbi:MAG: peptidase [Burkholderiales bacterium]|nr:peptidase [Burkholderiales bacterium]